MSDRAKEMIPEIGKVWTACLAAFCVSKFKLMAIIFTGADLKLFLECTSLLAATGYTLWRWHKDARKKRK